MTDSKSVGSDTVWVRVPPPAPAQKFPPPFRFRLCRKLPSGGNFFAFGPDSLRWIRVRRGRGMWVGALYLSCQEFIKRETGIACLSFWYAPPLPTVKVGRCGGLMEIAREKRAKGFSAHTLFLAKSESDCVETGRLLHVGTESALLRRFFFLPLGRCFLGQFFSSNTVFDSGEDRPWIQRT